ncbi:hypothetical protein Ahy_B08g092984 [Arachis hypogaea]|uniref:Aminotransferase-like plant mobile domain-containing protein n=1 Tax=Arachis hypogaea TaxID=3818 RepID=A0A444Y522_ARAHY|nr:hypothetical protein Ahy_B08g092984 [Arachis hypogaea]
MEETLQKSNSNADSEIRWDMTPPSLHILNQINDEIIEDPQLQIDYPRILILFTVGGETHCFIGLIDSLERANKRLHFFPSAQGKYLLINQDLDISFFTNPQKAFRNNPKIAPRGTDFMAWHRHLTAEKNAALDNEPVTDDEHVAFLFYWLNAIVFCSRNVQMQKIFYPLAALLHEGNNFNLAKTWTNLLAVQVIPIGLPQYKKEHFKATLYAPHYASRQLGFSQAIPFPLPKNNKPLCHINLVSKEALDVYLSSNQQQKMGYHHLVYERSSFITKSCFDWWTAYFSKYNCIFEEIRNSATRIASIAEGSPKKSLKRKAKTTSFSRQPQRKSQRTPSRTSRRVQSSSKSSSEDNEPLIQNLPAASLDSDDDDEADPASQLIRRRRQIILAGAFTGSHVAPDSDSASQIPESNSDSPSRVPETTAPESDSPTQIPETISSPQKSLNPPRDAGISTSHDLDPPSETLGMIPQPTDTDLIGLVNILNQVVQEDKVPAQHSTIVKKFIKVTNDYVATQNKLQEIKDKATQSTLKQRNVTQLFDQ